MERKIALSELSRAITDAYEAFKSLKEGTPDPRVQEVDPKTFGIAAVLTDGTVVAKADSKAAVAMGSIVKIPTAALLLQQNTPEELLKKSGHGCCCKCQAGDAPKPEQKPDIPMSSHGVRAVSAVVPSGDPDGKWDIMIGNIINMMGSAPDLDDKLFKALVEQYRAANAEDVLARDEYYLYDNAATALEQYAKLLSLRANAEQLATLAATVAADGVNPLNNQVAFDGALSQTITAMVAAKGPHRMTLPWMVRTGLPAKSGLGGGIVGIVPGVMGIAAVAPALGPSGVSIKGAKALAMIMDRLQLSVYSSARVEIVKD